MRPDTAERLLRATGASPLFIDDVLGDLEELRAQRRQAGQPSGRWWFCAEVLRTLPHALRSGLQGAGVSQLVDWGQKALAAWVLLGAAAVVGGAMVYGVWALVTPPADRPPIWFPSDLALALLLLAGAVNYLLLGYVAAWMERDRPLMVTLIAALLGVVMHSLMVLEGIRDVGAGVLVVPMLVGCLVSIGGVWRVSRPVPRT